MHRRNSIFFDSRASAFTEARKCAKFVGLPFFSRKIKVLLNNLQFHLDEMKMKFQLVGAHLRAK
jgi:polysaccharide deacetylase 2 family uncharacterized protein YibQ